MPSGIFWNIKEPFNARGDGKNGNPARVVFKLENKIKMLFLSMNWTILAILLNVLMSKRMHKDDFITKNQGVVCSETDYGLTRYHFLLLVSCSVLPVANPINLMPFGLFCHIEKCRASWTRLTMFRDTLDLQFGISRL